MSEFPRLFPSAILFYDTSGHQLTPGPYGEATFSSLLCLTLWKSYLFSCRTKLAKLLCLKCLGSMDLVNRSFCTPISQTATERSMECLLTSNTTKLSISSPHRTTDAYDGSSSILCCTSALRTHARSRHKSALDLGAPYLYNFRTYAGVSRSARQAVVQQCDIQNHSNCSRPRRRHSDFHPSTCACRLSLEPRIRITNCRQIQCCYVTFLLIPWCVVAKAEKLFPKLGAS